MKIEQLYTSCLAEAAYFVASDGEALIIDPLRDVDQYIALADKNGAKIKYILETHFHADFVSGHQDLAEKTGATIVFGPSAKPNFEALIVEDSEILDLGSVKIKVLHTPGHTMESTTFLLIDENGKDHAIFTGDALLLGDVGRPDLAVKTDLTKEDLAGHLFDSLRNKIMPLADDVIVYPNHGKGSACGKNMSELTQDTLGNQKQFNYALRSDMTRDEFIKEVTADLVKPPQYFPKNAVMNKMGYERIDEILKRGMTALDVSEFKAEIAGNKALILDTRGKQLFAEGHIPGAFFIGIDDTFAPWVGALISDLRQPIVFIADEGKEEEVVTRLARVGYENAVGFLKGGIATWIEDGGKVSFTKQITPEVFAAIYNDGKNLIDVRKQSEFEAQHVERAVNFPLDRIFEDLDKLDKTEILYLNCAGGYRSMIACSILQANGFEKVINILGGFEALKNLNISLRDSREQVTML